jgi:hypothetical protein
VTIVANIIQTLSPSKYQFQWLADQLRASRAIIAISPVDQRSAFGAKLDQLKIWTKGESEKLSSYVNNGMQGTPTNTLLMPEWQYQFRYRALGSGGIKQYPNGDLYLPPLVEDPQLKMFECEVNPYHPITSVIFRLNVANLGKPEWRALIHRNMRPPMAKRVRKNKVFPV